MQTLRVLLAATFALGSPALAEDNFVRLATEDGTLDLEGVLIEFDGEFFRVETEFGALTVDGGNVDCTGPGCPDPEALVAEATVVGPAEMVHGLMPALVQGFADREDLTVDHVFLSDDAVSWTLSDTASGHDKARIAGRVTDGVAALDRLAARDADLAFGRITPGQPVQGDVIALDALVPVVAPDNALTTLTLGQLQRLLSGRTTSWDAVGGPDLPVALHLPKDDTARQLFESRLPGQNLRYATTAALYDDLVDLSDAVAADPAALGLAPLSLIGNAVPMVVSGPCGLAVPATRASIKSEDYPLTQPLFLSRMGARQPKIIRDFVAFARSHEAQAMIRASGFIDQAIGELSIERQGGRIANAVLNANDDYAQSEVRRMIETLQAAARLTLTFRFEDGSTDLDPQSTSNIRRLADAIERGDFDGRALLFVGFSDGFGDGDANQRLSKRRAEAVERAVIRQLGETRFAFETRGFGESLPMACDDSPWGRQVNRRVEVWVR